MYEGLLHAHSGLRWLVLILLLVSIVKSFSGSKERVLKDKKLFSMTLASIHLQILIGIGIYIISPLIKGYMAGDNMMKDAMMRFFVVEHLVMMILAGVAITIGYSKFKKRPDLEKKYAAIKIFYILTLIIILYAIPWPFREIGLGRGWY